MAAAPASDSAIAAYLAIWGLFTFGLFFGTLKLNRALQFVFASLTVLFFLRAAAHATKNAAFKKIAGYEGILCGASSIYAGIANAERSLRKDRYAFRIIAKFADTGTIARHHRYERI